MSLRKLKWRGIGRLELLAWLNEFLETDYTKIEHLADGIAYCQIFDALYPGKVNIQKLNFHARTEMEFERNLRVLRHTFHLCDIRKEIPIRKLIQGIFQEHFEFLHWIHDYVHRTCPDAVRSYHGFERRQEVLRQSSSQPQSNASNTKLIPKYSNSMKIPFEAYIDLSLTDVGDNTYDDISASIKISEDQSVDGTSGGDKGLDSMDPLMQSVRHSFPSTLRAKMTLASLEECIESIGVKSSKAKPPVKKEMHRGPKSGSGRLTKSRVTTTIDDPAEPDPMMYRHLSDLFECLESELLGRVKDLDCLENDIKKLLAAKPSQRKNT